MISKSWQDPNIPFPHELWEGCPKCGRGSVVTIPGKHTKCMTCGLEYHPNVHDPAPLSAKVIDLNAPMVERSPDGVLPPCARCSRVMFIPTDEMVFPWRGAGIVTVRCVYCLKHVQVKLC